MDVGNMLAEEASPVSLEGLSSPLCGALLFCLCYYTAPSSKDDRAVSLVIIFHQYLHCLLISSSHSEVEVYILRGFRCFQAGIYSLLLHYTLY